MHKGIAMLLSDMINRCRKFHDYALHFNDVSLIDFNNNDSFLGNLKLFLKKVRRDKKGKKEKQRKEKQRKG